MRIGIVSDTHFGYKRWEADALSQATDALLDAAKKCDVILMPGDIFDSRIPRPETFHDSIKALQATLASKKWAAKCINRPGAPPIAAIHGTHELRGRELVNPIQILETIGLLADVHNSTAIYELDGRRVAITGLGGVPEDLAAAAIEKAGFAPHPNAFNIFVFHQSVSELMYAGGKSIMSLDDLPKGFDLYVCGHLHKYQTALDGKLIIPGSTVLTQLKEEEAGPKGYVIFDSATGKHEFVPVKTREFIFKKLRFDNATPTQIQDAVDREFSQILAEGRAKPIVRIVIEGTLKDGFSPQDVRILKPEMPGAVIEVDSKLDMASLKEKIEAIRHARQGKMTVAEFGMGILRKQCADAGIAGLDVDDAFSTLIEDTDAAYESFMAIEAPREKQA
ncbi:MAG TPA: DNA repair exonuclease [Candidatus Micrarchaeota archaeon]|nr:DNA repair exonuclease [Candidatus Micrarchaeota archaeon]